MTKKITTEFLRERFKITPEKVDLAVKILVKLYSPLKIYVFGSYAQGKHDYGSDVDLMIVIPEFTNHPWEVIADGYGSLSEVRMAVDLILYDKARFDQHSADPMSFCTQILKTGKLLYEKV